MTPPSAERQPVFDADRRPLSVRFDEALAAREADALALLCTDDVAVDVDGEVTRGRPRALAALLASRARTWNDTLELRDGRIAVIRRTTRTPDVDDEQLAVLVEREAALRRLAELAARGAPRREVFDAIVAEGARLLGTTLLTLARYEPERMAKVVALHGAVGGYGVGTRHPVNAGNVLGAVLKTGRPARVTCAKPPTKEPDHSAWRGCSAAIGAPIHVNGELWGALVASAREEELPPSLDARLGTFAELLGPAIAGAQARAELMDLLDEQAALRRVAELVARGSQAALFQAVADEASRLVEGDATTLMRLNADASVGTVLATSGSVPAALGTEVVIGPDDVGLVAQIVRTRAPRRIDDYQALAGPSYARDDYGLQSSAGVPIIVDDELWGVLAFSTTDHELPPLIERRLQQFAELVAAALANAQARSDVQALADEQAALRRVAELVARAALPTDVFGAVAKEAAGLLGAPMTLARFDGEDGVVVVASNGASCEDQWADSHAPYALAAAVRGSARAARHDEAQRTSAAAAPINIGGRVWGLLAATSTAGPLPPRTEDRLAQFAELIAAAIANAESRAALAASRARVMATADEVRRRIQRDVHDGAQQRLVHTVLTLKLAQQELRGVGGPVAELVDESLEQAQKAAAELGDVVRGILPAALTRGGLRAGLESLATDLPVDVDLRVECDRLGADLETTAYFVAAEALTNVVKHAHADRASVVIAVDGDWLAVDIRDDGVGGAHEVRGTGITGLFDRVGAAGGTLTVASPPGAGTRVLAKLPLQGPDAAMV